MKILNFSDLALELFDKLLIRVSTLFSLVSNLMQPILLGFVVLVQLTVVLSQLPKCFA